MDKTTSYQNKHRLQILKIHEGAHQGVKLPVSVHMEFNFQHEKFLIRALPLDTKSEIPVEFLLRGSTLLKQALPLI
jgi:hypothetical protein